MAGSHQTWELPSPSGEQKAIFGKNSTASPLLRLPWYVRDQILQNLTDGVVFYPRPSCLKSATENSARIAFTPEEYVCRSDFFFRGISGVCREHHPSRYESLQIQVALVSRQMYRDWWLAFSHYANLSHYCSLDSLVVPVRANPFSPPPAMQSRLQVVTFKLGHLKTCSGISYSCIEFFLIPLQQMPLLRRVNFVFYIPSRGTHEAQPVWSDTEIVKTLQSLSKSRNLEVRFKIDCYGTRRNHILIPAFCLNNASDPNRDAKFINEITMPDRAYRILDREKSEKSEKSEYWKVIDESEAHVRTLINEGIEDKLPSTQAVGYSTARDIWPKIVTRRQFLKIFLP